MTINNVGNYSNRATELDVQVQFIRNSAIISHQYLLSGIIFGIIHDEVLVLILPTYPIIENNKPAMTISTGVIQAPQELKTPITEEIVAVITVYNTVANKNTWRVSKNGLDGSTPPNGGSGTSYVVGSIPDFSYCTSQNPPSVLWNGTIWKYKANYYPKFQGNSEFKTHIDRRFSNDSNAMSVVSQIFFDELSLSYERDICSCCRIGVTIETVQPMVPQLVSHGLNKNIGICNRAISSIRGILNTIFGRTVQ